jgi:putative hemin transport protein
MSVEAVERIGSPSDLYDAFLHIREERKLRQRDAAQALGVAEGAIIAASVGRGDGLRATRLTGPWPELFEEIPFLGKVMALTRNESTVHEKVGTYEKMSHEGLVGLALGPDIDLRIFYMHWAHAYAVTEESPKGTARSLQVYDKYGCAVHKIFLRGTDDDLMTWYDFVERHADANQAAGEAFETDRPAPSITPDVQIDAEGFRAGWRGMKDTHEFFPLLRRFKVARTQALRLAPDGLAYRVGKEAARQLLQEASQGGNSIMCFVGNPGMIQIHTGPVKRVEVMGNWLNVLDASFNLHMREDMIEEAWVVRKPTTDGVVTSVEFFEKNGDVMAMFFGERKPGKPELADWRALVDRIPKLAA